MKEVYVVYILILQVKNQKVYLKTRRRTDTAEKAIQAEVKKMSWKIEFYALVRAEGELRIPLKKRREKGVEVGDPVKVSVEKLLEPEQTEED